MSEPEPGGEFWVHCAECRHVWIVAILPMPVEDFAQLAKRAACPHGHRARVLCGKPHGAPACDDPNRV